MKTEIKIYGIYEDEKSIKVCDILQDDIKYLNIKNTISYTKNNKETNFKVFTLKGTITRLNFLFERNKEIITRFKNHYVLTTKNV